ncbi:MAG: rhodanese-like domain-containing protein [Burkholderiales bacterium]|nr:rhodanese-like domain-containing protein [Burkholderiales bacterium]MDE2395824.1 rhodanese-like domain-containing protein [Burkholderiales bacterium]MDE2453351.1 rhodanese-like domain-containing protein [Burkholderiales bacterium]
MKFLLDNWSLVLVALASGGLLLWPMIRGGVGAGGSAVASTEAVRLINREKGVLIDVCEPAEYAAGHAVGARNIPLATLEGAKGLPANKALPVIVICPSGQRAARAVGQLRKAGYANAVSVAGGTAAWREASLPIEKSS